MRFGASIHAVATVLSTMRATPPTLMEALPPPPPPLPAAPLPDQLGAIMTGCAVQAQLSYYNEFKSELQGRWLESFLGHEHLKVERIDSRGGGRLLFRGLSDVLRCEWREYFRTMLSSKPEKYKCRYKVGTADTVGGPSAAASEAAASGANTGGEVPSWAAASASRAQNPYLQKAQPTYREFSITVEPKAVASGLMSIMRQLSNEWASDLGFVAREGAYLMEACADSEDGSLAEGCDVDSAPSSLLDAMQSNWERALVDTTIDLPDPLYTALRAASSSWMSDLNEDGVSPFRAENFDLLQRATTREAVLSVLASFEEAAALDSGCVEAASAAWLRVRVVEWLPRFEQPPRSQLAGLFCLSLLMAPPSPMRVGGASAGSDDDDDEGSSGGGGGGGTLRMVDPVEIAYRVLDERRTIASSWAEALGTGCIPDALQALLAEDMEKQLAATMGNPEPPPPSASEQQQPLPPQQDPPPPLEQPPPPSPDLELDLQQLELNLEIDLDQLLDEDPDRTRDDDEPAPQ